MSSGVWWDLTVSSPFCVFFQGFAHVGVVGVGEDLEDGQKEDFGVQGQGDVLHVPDIQLNAAVPLHVLPAVGLGPAGDAGPHVEHVPLELVVVLNGPGMVGEGRPGADEGHIPLEDVPELGQLVDGAGPQDPAHLGDPGVSFAAVDPGAGFLGVHHHGAELVEVEFLSALSQALLPEDHGALGAELHGGARRQDYRGKQNPRRGGQGQIQTPLHHPVIEPLGGGGVDGTGLDFVHSF